ncbi:hypothetical protein L843_0326 [Mycobacterium intracellulare MIN_061107_1834]|nr:hypothetical protein L843_0326 [Mycobacterium intracellulare MIN_061107_1834]
MAAGGVGPCAGGPGGRAAAVFRAGCRRSRRNSSRSFMGSSGAGRSVVAPCYVISATVRRATPDVTNTGPVSPHAGGVGTRKPGPVRCGIGAPPRSRH